MREPGRAALKWAAFFDISDFEPSAFRNNPVDDFGMFERNVENVDEFRQVLLTYQL
jgi:hypothetical protein